jgi:hypothetical protein
MVFFLEITNVWQKSRDLIGGFFSLDFLKQQTGIDFPMEFLLFSMCFINAFLRLLLILNMKSLWI